MKRKRRKLAAIICALTLALSSAVPVSACTPPLKPPSVEIPDITFQPDDALKEAISNAAKNWIEKCILGTPTVEYASYYKSQSRYFSYTYAAVKWSEVENATYYKVRITKLTERGKNTIRPIQHFTLPITQMILWQTGWMEQPLK